MADEISDIFKEEEAKTADKPVGEKKRGMRVTIGRCFDFILIAINIGAILISLVAFICLAVVIAQSTNAAQEIGLSSKQACLLFAGAADENNTDIGFTHSAVCYYLLASSPIIWCFIAFSLIFLSLKIWRTWNLGFFEIVIFISSLLCLFYALIATVVLTIGHSLTCRTVASLDMPQDAAKKQSCFSGGAYYKGDDLKFIRFEGYFFVAEIALWITCVILVALSLLYCSRLCIFSRRRSKRAELATEV